MNGGLQLVGFASGACPFAHVPAVQQMPEALQMVPGGHVLPPRHLPSDKLPSGQLVAGQQTPIT